MDLLGSWLFVLKRMELLKTFLQVDTALIEKTRKSKRSEVSKRSLFDKKIMRYCVLLQKYQKGLPVQKQTAVLTPQADLLLKVLDNKCFYILNRSNRKAP